MDFRWVPEEHSFITLGLGLYGERTVGQSSHEHILKEAHWSMGFYHFYINTVRVENDLYISCLRPFCDIRDV